MWSKHVSHQAPEKRQLDDTRAPRTWIYLKFVVPEVFCARVLEGLVAVHFSKHPTRRENQIFCLVIKCSFLSFFILKKPW